jgi:hypothetical protein
MRMGDKALTASIDRWAQCKGEECCDDAPVNGCNKNADDDEPEAPVAPAPAEAPAEDPAPAEEAPAPAPAPAEDAAPAEAPAEDVVEEAPAEAPAEASADEPADVEVSDELVDNDVDFDEPADNADNGADADIEACFAADGEEEVAPTVDSATPKKAGLKKLAGQPTLVRVASKNADDLAGVWDKWSNPDVR